MNNKFDSLTAKKLLTEYLNYNQDMLRRSIFTLKKIRF